MNSIKSSSEFCKSFSNWQMEALMEKLRTKACSLKSFPETAKSVKQGIMNKQHALDSIEKTALESCLDKLQHKIKVTSLPAMVERLETTAKELNLQFTSGTSGPEVYISCDMFYVEVHLQAEGKVRDVKVELAGDQFKPRGQSCPELVRCLSSGDFAEFSSHLEGFLSIYKLNTEKKNKCKAYQALQALEHDLLKLFEMAQDTITDTQRLIIKSPVGLLVPRKGGRSVRMIYFASPYELLDISSEKAVSLTYDSAIAMDLRHTASVNIEASTSHKLQTASLVNIIEGSDGLKLPSISGFNSSNSVSLPACFSLRLETPMPVSISVAAKISEVTGVSCYDSSSAEPLLPLIIREATGGNETDVDRSDRSPLFVTLPDQQHCYFMASGNGDFEGILLTHVPFTHPTSIAHILEYLRMQAIFNSLITSCVRPDSKQELDNAFVFELSAVSHWFISVTFEHPEEESTATAEIDLSEISNLRCRLLTVSANDDDTTDTPAVLCSDEYATKVLQRSLSIPITMRAIIRKAVKEEKEILTIGETSVKVDSNGGSSFPASDAHSNGKFFLNDFNSGGVGLRRDPLLLQGAPSGTVGVKASIGSNQQGPAMLGEDHMSATTTPPILGNITQKKQLQTHFLSDTKATKVRKRKSGLEVDSKSGKIIAEFLSDEAAKNSESYAETNLHLRKDLKLEKVSAATPKRRSSGEGLSSSGSSELAALREKVYGVGSAASFAKLSYLHKESVETSRESAQQKVKKQRNDQLLGPDPKRSPIVLDLTDAEGAKKKKSPSTSVSVSGGPSHSSALSAALLKRPGIEIIPIPGSNTPISIPSSITVTPVMKNSEDRYKDKKDRKDKKELEKKDKKRRRDDSPSSQSFPHSGSTTSSVSSSANNANNRNSKLQIITSSSSLSSSKHSGPFTTTDNSKMDKCTPSSVTMKTGSPFPSPVKKLVSSSNLLQQKLSSSLRLPFNSSQKSNKTAPSPNSGAGLPSNPAVSKVMTSPKQNTSTSKPPTLSPKHSSIGKPSMNALKTSSPTFSKNVPSLSPKLSKGAKEKGCSPAQSPNTSPILSSSSNISPTSTKSKSNTPEKPKPGFPEALTITKISSVSDTLPTTSGMSSLSSPTSSSSLLEKLSLEKAKASPPKNRKGSSLSDIVDKLRAGVTGSSDTISVTEKPEMEKDKKEPNKKTDTENFMMKSNSGLKFTFKNKSKESKSSSSSSSSGSNVPSTKSSTSSCSKSSSGLKPGTMSGPASKKASISNLPPIPKLPQSSSFNAGQNSASPLSSSATMSSSPLQYGRDRQMKEKDRLLTPNVEKQKNKDSSMAKNSAFAEAKKDSDVVGSVSKQIHTAEKIVKMPSYATNAPNLIDSVDRALKNMFGEDDERAEPNLKYSGENNSSTSITEKAAQDTTPSTAAYAAEKEGKSNADCLETNCDESVSMPPPAAPGNIKPREESSSHDNGSVNRSEMAKSGGDGPSSGTETASSTPVTSPAAPQHPSVTPSVISSPPLGQTPVTCSSGFPPSPSVSIKIVKSPATPSPINAISPQSGASSQPSPCLIDDELMDEALMGSRQ